MLGLQTACSNIVACCSGCTSLYWCSLHAACTGPDQRMLCTTWVAETQESGRARPLVRCQIKGTSRRCNEHPLQDACGRRTPAYCAAHRAHGQRLRAHRTAQSRCRGRRPPASLAQKRTRLSQTPSSTRLVVSKPMFILQSRLHTALARPLSTCYYRAQWLHPSPKVPYCVELDPSLP